MGVVVEKKLNSDNPKIIDYANSKLRSDFMDVYLAANCSFCISTGYGFEDLPCVFRKPLVQLILPLGDAYTHNEKYLIMTKRHILKKDKREMSLSEIFSSGAAYTYDTKNFEKIGVELVDYTEEEIRDVVLEMAESLLNLKEKKIEDEDLQKKFKDLYISKVKSINYNKNTKNIHHYKQIFHTEIRSRYSTKFLKENKNWLK